MRSLTPRVFTRSMSQFSRYELPTLRTVNTMHSTEHSLPPYDSEDITIQSFVP